MTDISVDYVIMYRGEILRSKRSKIQERWFVIEESSVCAPLLVKDMQFEAFVLSAVFIMDQSLC